MTASHRGGLDHRRRPTNVRYQAVQRRTWGGPGRPRPWPAGGPPRPPSGPRRLGPGPPAASTPAQSTHRRPGLRDRRSSGGQAARTPRWPASRSGTAPLGSSHRSVCLGTLSGTDAEPLLGWHEREQPLGGNLVRAAVDPGPQWFGALDRQDVGDRLLLKPDSQPSVAAVDGVAGDPPGRHPSRHGALEHGLGELGLGAEGELVGHAGLGAEGQVVGPAAGQVQLPVHQRMTP